jgi:hypothetical protein
MKSLPVIPASREQRWLRFRTQGLPVLGFLLLAACITLMWRNVVLPPALPSGSASTASTSGGSIQSPQMPRIESAKAQTPAAHKDVAVVPRKRITGLQ